MEKQNKQSEPSFYVNFEKVYARNIDSNISLLNFLRHNYKFTGTKEGCSEGAVSYTHLTLPTNREV